MLRMIIIQKKNSRNRRCLNFRLTKYPCYKGRRMKYQKWFFSLSSWCRYPRISWKYFFVNRQWRFFRLKNRRFRGWEIVWETEKKITCVCRQTSSFWNVLGPALFILKKKRGVLGSPYATLFEGKMIRKSLRKRQLFGFRLLTLISPFFRGLTRRDGVLKKGVL